MPQSEPETRRPGAALVASDNALRSSLRMLLAVSGVQVREYRNARDYLAAPADPDRCLVADCRLADLPGRALCLEAIRRSPGAPIIVLTDSPEEFAFVRAARANVRVLSKPFDGDRLLDAVKEVLDRSASAGPRDELLTEHYPAAS